VAVSSGKGPGLEIKWKALVGLLTGKRCHSPEANEGEEMSPDDICCMYMIRLKLWECLTILMASLMMRGC
jgi:hypothetical protein